MSKPQDYSKLLEEAENQVANIKDDKLKEIAYAKLVDHLLSASQVISSKPPGITPPSIAKTKNIKEKKAGPKSFLEELHSENFFNTPKSSSEILDELETRSHHLKATDLTKPLETLCHDRVLRRKKSSPTGGGKAVYRWSNW